MSFFSSNCSSTEDIFENAGFAAALEDHVLQSLIVSGEQIATESVAKALQGFVSLVKETGEVLPSSAFTKLDGNRKILVYLLALRAASLLDLGQKKVHATPEEIAQFIGADPQRARELLSRMKKKFLSKTSEGWELPPSRIPVVCDEIISKKK